MQMLQDIGHPVRRGRAGLRHHVRERAGRRAHQPPVPPRQPPRRARRRHRRPDRARARLVHLRRRRPHVALQRQRARAQDADPAPDPLGRRTRGSSARDGERGAAVDPRHRDLAPSWSPATATTAAGAEHARTRSARTSCRTSTSTTSLRFGYAPSKVAFLAYHAWRDASAAPGRTCSADERNEYDLATIKKWLGVFLYRFFQTSQFKRSAHARTARRSAPAARSPRAATGARRATRRPRSGWTNSNATFPIEKTCRTTEEFRCRNRP